MDIYNTYIETMSSVDPKIKSLLWSEDFPLAIKKIVSGAVNSANNPIALVTLIILGIKSSGELVNWIDSNISEEQHRLFVSEKISILFAINNKMDGLSDYTRLQAILNANSKQKYLYWYYLPYKAISFYQKVDYIKSIKTIGDLILGFYKIEDTVPLLQQELGLDPKTAALLGAEVLEFLAPLSDPNWQPPIEDEGNEVTGETPDNITPTANIPVKAPAFYASAPDMIENTKIETAPNTNIAIPSDTVAVPTSNNQPTQDLKPSYEPTPTYSAPRTNYNPTPEPIYQSTQPSTYNPLSNTPSYSIPNIPTPPPPTPPAPDRPRWSSEI